MCLTTDSDLPGGSGRGARQASPLLSLPQLSSEPRGSQQECVYGETRVSGGPDSHLGRGTPGFRIRDLAENSCFLLKTQN